MGALAFIAVILVAVWVVRAANAKMMMGKFERNGFTVTLTESGLWNVRKQEINLMLNREGFFSLGGRL